MHFHFTDDDDEHHSHTHAHTLYSMHVDHLTTEHENEASPDILGALNKQRLYNPVLSGIMSTECPGNLLRIWLAGCHGRSGTRQTACKFVPTAQKTSERKKGYPDRLHDLACPGPAKMDRCHYCRWRAVGKDNEGIRDAEVTFVSAKPSALFAGDSEG